MSNSTICLCDPSFDGAAKLPGCYESACIGYHAVSFSLFIIGFILISTLFILGIRRKASSILVKSKKIENLFE